MPYYLDISCVFNQLSKLIKDSNRQSVVLFQYQYTALNKLVNESMTHSGIGLYITQSTSLNVSAAEFGITLGNRKNGKNG